MIQLNTRLQVLDNSGPKEVNCIKVYNKTGIAKMGDIILVSVKHLRTSGRLKKGDIRKAMVVTSKKGLQMNDTHHISFALNGVVIVNKPPKSKDWVPVATRLFGPFTHPAIKVLTPFSV